MDNPEAREMIEQLAKTLCISGRKNMIAAMAMSRWLNHCVPMAIMKAVEQAERTEAAK